MTHLYLKRNKSDVGFYHRTHAAITLRVEINYGSLGTGTICPTRLCHLAELTELTDDALLVKAAHALYLVKAAGLVISLQYATVTNQGGTFSTSISHVLRGLNKRLTGLFLLSTRNSPIRKR